jgi:hypothetical protein
MTLQAPFYLAVGSLVLESGSGDGTYRVVRETLSFPEPPQRENDESNEPHVDATRLFTVKCQGATAALAEDAFNALRRAIVKDAILGFRHGESGDVFETAIKRGSVTESVYRPLDRDGVTRGTCVIVADVVLVTEPYWHTPWGDLTTVTVKDPGDTFPFTFDIPAPKGTAQAELSIRIAPDQASAAIAASVWPDPSEDFAPIDDYSGSSDVTCYGGAKRASAELTAALAVVGTAPEIDVNANRDAHVVQARVSNSGTAAAACSFAVRSGVDGSGMTSVTEHDENPVASALATGEGFEVVTLGVPDVPTAEVPGDYISSGYAEPTVAIQGPEATGTYALSSTEHSQTFYWPGGYMEKFMVKLAGSGSVRMRLLTAGGGVLDTISSSVTTTANFYSLIQRVLAAGTYKIGLTETSGAITVQYASGGGYTGGAWDAGGDLEFQVYERAVLGFGAYTKLLAASSESGKYCYLDYLVRFPTKNGFLLAVAAFAAEEGLYYDGENRMTYNGNDTTGIGPALGSAAKLFSPLLLTPGVINRVIVNAYPPPTAAPQGGAIIYQVRERWLSPMKGS